MSNLNGPGFAVSGASVDLLVGEVNSNFAQEGGRDPNVDLSDLLFVDRPGQGSEGGMISMDGVYPLSVLSWSVDEKGDTEKRNFGEGGVVEIGPIRAARRDGPSVIKPRRRSYDKYGLIMNAIKDMARWGKHLWLWLSAQKLIENGNSYDSVAFFHASAHLVNPLEQGGDTFGNLLSNTELDEAGVGAAFDKLGQVPGLDGKSLANSGMMQPAIMVPTWPLYLKALHLFGFPGALIPTAAGTAPMTTVLAGRAKVIYNPFLYSEHSNKTTAAKQWYVISDAGNKPMIVREEEAPQIVMTTDADWPRHERDALLAYIAAYCSVGYGEHRSIVRAQTA